MVRLLKLTIPNAAKDVSKWYNHFGKQFGYFIQSQTTFTIWPKIPSLEIYLKEMKTPLKDLYGKKKKKDLYDPLKNFYAGAYSSFIYNSPKLGGTQMSIAYWIEH